MGIPKDISGQRFGRLVAIQVASVGARNVRRWLCRCDCGKTTEVVIGSLTSGNTQSCGCYMLDVLSRAGRLRTTHGMRSRADGQRADKTYRAWTAMKVRCLVTSDPAYKNYGARGVTLCERWLSFDNFYEDMGECPHGLTLDRIDNSAGYYKENCRWATYTDQNRNKRGVKLSMTAATEIRGDMRSNQEIATEYGVSRRSVALIKNGATWKP